MGIDANAVLTGAVLLLIGAIITVMTTGYTRKSRRANDLETRSIVDKAVAIAEQRAQDAITGAVNSLRMELQTGNGKTLGEYVKHLGDEMTGMRGEFKQMAGSIGDIDDRITDLEIGQRALEPPKP